VRVGDGVSVGVRVGDGVSVGTGDDVSVGVRVGDGVSVGTGDDVSVGVRVGDGVSVGTTGVRLGERVGAMVGVTSGSGKVHALISSAAMISFSPRIDASNRLSDSDHTSQV
jgi:hypothetical protein